MRPPAAPSRASAFETVAEAVVPPLPLDDRSPPRDAPPAPGAAGHDGRWNLAAATRAAFPERFPTLAAARKAVRRGEIRVAEPHHESDAPAPSAPASSAPASSAPASSTPAPLLPRRGDYRPRPGAFIAVSRRTSASPAMDPSALPPSATLPEIAYEDAHCAIVVKPEGVPTVGDAEWTAESALPYVLEPAVGVEGALPRPRPTHRLDKPTGGLLLCAKTRLAQETLGAAFEARRVIKRYRALLYVDARDDERRRRAASEKKGAGDAGEDACGVIGGAALLGNPEQSTRRDVGGVVSAALGGRAASTRWRRVRFERGTRDSRAGLALVDMWPKTGRTHQLRRHAAETLLAPILGDGRYAKREHRAGALVSTTVSTTTKTRGGGDDAEGAGEEGGEEGEGEGGEGLFLFAAELSLPLSAMPWLGGGDARGEGGEGVVGKTLEGGLLASGGRRRVGERDVVTAEEAGATGTPGGGMWLRVRVSEPGKFAARLERERRARERDGWG